MTAVLLVEDHPIVRAGVRRLLSSFPEFEIHEASTGEDALVLLPAKRPELVILDLNLPKLGGVELLRRLLQEAPDTLILVLSMHTEPLYATRTLAAGARGYVSKNATPEELITAVQRVMAGGRYIEADIAQEIALQGTESFAPLQHLTERELEIMRLLAEGRSLQQVADAMDIAYKTAANICSQMKAKLGAARTADLVRMAHEFGVL